eukprot:9891732-Alexandrium_andersonii.AAC.1
MGDPEGHAYTTQRGIRSSPSLNKGGTNAVPNWNDDSDQRTLASARTRRRRQRAQFAVSYTHLRAHETSAHL